MSIHKRQTKTGVRYDVKLRTSSGKAYQQTFRTKREAETYEAAQMTAVSQGTWIDKAAGNITFSELAKHWLTSNSNKRRRSLERDEGILRNHLIPELGDRLISGIRSSDIQALINCWVMRGLRSGTIIRHRAVLSGIFNLALNDDLLLRTPMRGLKTPKAEALEGWALSPEETQRLLHAIRDEYYPLVFILLTTGLRFSEAAGLCIKHVNLLHQPATLSVEQGLHETSNGLVIEQTKSLASKRIISLVPQQVEVIARHIEATGRSGANADEPLFVSPRGSRLAYKNFHDRIWKPAVHDAGLKGLKIHDLRKTAATNLLAAGIQIKTVTSLMGHEDIRTTLKHYAQTSPQSLLEASETLVNAILLPEGDSTRQERI